MTDRTEDALRDLAAALAFPPTPDMRRAIADRLLQPPPPSRPRAWPGVWPRAIVLAVLLSILGVAVATALVLVLPGLRLTVVPTLPSADVPAGPLATRLVLGEPISPDAIANGIPSVIGPPDEAYIAGDAGVVSLVYAADADLAELSGSGIGLLVQVIDGALERERVEKLVVQGGTSVTAVQVGRVAGYWIEGRPHLIRFLDRDGVGRSEATRLAGDTLVWERDGRLFRIESGLGLAATLRIAESIP